MRFLTLFLCFASVAHSATMQFTSNYDANPGSTQVLTIQDSPGATATLSTTTKANGTGSYFMDLNRTNTAVNTYRSEFNVAGSGGDFQFNTEYWVNLNFRYENWPSDTDRDFSPFQIHRRPGTNPATGNPDWNCDLTSAYATAPFFMSTVNDTVEIRGWPNGTLFWSAPMNSTGITKNAWHNLVLRFNISSSNTGYLEAWIDNVKRFSKLNYALFTTGTDSCGRQFNPNYWKNGIYKWNWKAGRPATGSTRRSVYIDDLNIAVGANGYNLVYEPPTGTTTPDTTPPTITGTSATNITQTTATITWNTNEVADSRVDYGLTTSYGSNTVDASDVTAHSINLSGLTANTLYHFKVTSADPSNNSSVSSDFTFTTQSVVVDTTPPVITNIAVNPSSSSAVFTYTTDEPATTRAKILTPISVSNYIATLVTSHEATITGLTPGTNYTYKITSVDGSGNQTDISTGLSFVTPSISPPEISGISVSGITDTSATINWTTDTSSNSVVNYGLTTAYGATQSNASNVTSHSIVLTGLNGGTGYNYRVCSTDTNALTTCSGNQTFSTVENGVPVISGISAATTNNSITFTWTTDVGSTTKVCYGTTATIGTCVEDLTSVTSHSIQATGLSAATRYYYRVYSENSAGQPAISAYKVVMTRTTGGLYSDRFN